MFEANFTVTIGLRTTQGKTDIIVRWPSDEEWAKHHKGTHLRQRSLGRGVGLNAIETAQADAKLYETIKLNGAPPLTPGEASYIIQAISRCVVTNVDLGATDAEVELNTLAGDAKHTLRIPFMDEIQAFQRTTQHMSLPNNVMEARANLEAGAELWDKCGGRHTGYEGPVPIIHKDAAIRAVIQAVENEASPSYGEGNF